MPVSSRLSAVLEMRRTDPKGENLPATAHVFGTETGDEVKSVKTAWSLTCRRAGITGLHLHDLRREFGSRLLEAGASLHQVRDFLGHGNVSMTSTYLSTSAEHLFDAMRKFEHSRAIRTPFAQNGNSATDTPSKDAAATEPKALN